MHTFFSGFSRTNSIFAASALVAILFAGSFSSTAHAEQTRAIDAPRISLGDLVPSVPTELASTDLGPAPPPGGTRTVGRNEMIASLTRAGKNPTGVMLPIEVKVVSAAKHWGAEELAKDARPAVEHVLPEGVTLVRADVTVDATVSPRATVGNVSVPRIPKQRGPFRATATMELVVAGDIVARIPVAITLDVSEAAARADVKKGSRVDVVVEHGAVRVTTSASVLQDGDVGDVVSAELATGRTTRVRLASRTSATLAEVR